MRIAIVVAVACLSVASLCAGQDVQASIKKSTNIPAQELVPALKTLAHERGFHVVFLAEVVGNRHTQGAVGDLTTTEALTRLLEGTNLVYSYLDDKTVTILPVNSNNKLDGEAPSAGNLHRCSGLSSNKLGYATSLNQTGSGSTAIGWTGSEGASDCVESYSQENQVIATRIASAAGEPVQNSDGDSSLNKELTSGVKLDEIVVTAQRREENQQRVPIAITVVSQQTLQENNIQTLGTLQYLIPSMSATTILSRDAIAVNIRGQGSNATSGLPGVVAYLNEVPIPTDFDGNLEGGPGLLFDLENVEVLKGPQGTLFGRNSVGGALLLQTARPTSDFGGHIQLGYGTYNDREVDGAINLPIVNDKLLTRVAFNGQVRDGFTKVTGMPGRSGSIDADDRDYWSVRGTVSFRPNEAFQNDTILTYGKYASHGSPAILTNVNAAVAAVYDGLFPGIGYGSLPALLAQQQELGIHTAIPVSVHLESSGSNLSLNNISRVSLNDALTFRNIFGLDEANQVLALDSDATSGTIIDVPSTPRDFTRHQITDEAQLLGDAFAGRLHWIAGAFYLDDHLPLSTTSAVAFGGPSVLASHVSEKSTALFAQGDYDLSSLITGLKFTAGVRYTWDERSARDFNCDVTPSVNCNTPAATAAPTRTAKSSAPTWTVGLDYKAAPDTLIYLTSRQGYRAGGPNPVDNHGVPLPAFGPEYVTDVELGVKSDWRVANVPVRTNAAIYYQNYRDIQTQGLVVRDFVPYPFTTNAATARVTGAEFEALAQLTQNLLFGASFNYLDFTYTNFGPNVDGPYLTAEQPAAPRHKYGVNARYHVPLARRIGDISVRADWNWQSSSVGRIGSPGDVSNGGLIPAFGLLNMSADWGGIVGTPLDVSLFVSNVTDKAYSIGGFAFYNLLGYATTRYGEPRMYGIRFRYRFGPS